MLKLKSIDQYNIISMMSTRLCFPAMPIHTTMSATPSTAVRRVWGSVQWRDLSDRYFDGDSCELRGAPCGRVAHLREAAEDR